MDFYTDFPVVQHLPIEKLRDSPFQPREDYGDIEELAESIKSIGLREPILVRPLGDEYEIVHGHRRKRTLVFLGSKFAPCYVQPMSDKEAIEVALNQNIQNMDLNALEEARAFSAYLDQFDVSARVLAKRIGKSWDYVVERVRLLDLPVEIQRKVASGEMYFSHARELIDIIDRKDEVMAIAAKVEEGVLKDKMQIADAVRSVKAGADIEEAVSVAKYRAFKREMARTVVGKRSVKEILETIRRDQIGPEEMLEARQRASLDIVVGMLEQELLVCPDCGKAHLSWPCTGRELG